MENPQKSARSLAGTGAEIKIEACGYSKNSLSKPACQPTPISWLIRAKFIESFVCQRFTRENSLKVDSLLIFAEFLEETSNACN